MAAILVNTKDKGLIDLSTFPARRWVLEFCKCREFESLEELNQLLRVVDVSKEAYDRGLGCPADARRALSIIEKAPEIELLTAVVTSKESGKDVYDTCKALAKQGRIIHWGKIEDPRPGRKFWLAEVVTGIKRK